MFILHKLELEEIQAQSSMTMEKHEMVIWFLMLKNFHH